MPAAIVGGQFQQAGLDHHFRQQRRNLPDQLEKLGRATRVASAMPHDQQARPGGGFGRSLHAADVPCRQSRLDWRRDILHANTPHQSRPICRGRQSRWPNLFIITHFRLATESAVYSYLTMTVGSRAGTNFLLDQNRRIVWVAGSNARSC